MKHMDEVIFNKGFQGAIIQMVQFAFIMYKL